MCFFRSTTNVMVITLLVSTLTLSTVVQALQVIGGSATVVQGGTAILPCTLIDTTEPLTQISWQRKTRGKPQNDNFFTIVYSNGPQFVNGQDDRFKFIGDVKNNNGSLQLSRVTLIDEGTYTCIFTLFPSGNHKTEISLTLLVPPVINLTDDLPTLGNERVSLVTCTAAASKPPAEVKWVTGTLVEKVRVRTNSTKHANDTTTTVSSLFGVPTRELNQHVVQCVVSSSALPKEEILPFTIQVYFPPIEVNIIERSKGLFECVTEANPNANITWSRSDQSLLPSAVRVVGATLQFLSVSSEVNGLYQCETSNPYGRRHGYLYVSDVPSAACPTCWTLFVLVLILIVAAAAVLYFYKSRRERGQRVPTTESPVTSAREGAGGVEAAALAEVRTHAEEEEPV
ncbi:nectin-1-like isoform X1 [Micropterus dolomieu]|uniref:nectin-1-like isoform X1 n=1 Tax=Micropterus dolomieu TaxID=147949 RepID=UPI001E8D39E5|nr:nectin-1-like isoform X1 [Micropterus dolomieu]